MQSLLLERYLCIEGDYLSNFLMNNHPRAFVGSEFEKPEVQVKSVENDLNRNELGWYFGIETEAVKNGLVAIIPVKGVLTRGWDWGCVSTEWLRTQIAWASGNVNVISIVFAVASPGGALNGTWEAAKEIRDCVKPTVAHISFSGCSGGFWLPSQADEIFIDSAKTTAVGSLGVYNILMSQYEMMQKQGIKAKILRWPENKALLHPFEQMDENDPVVKAAIEKELGVVKLMREEFVDSVRAKRPQISADIDGGVYYGREAIKMGLADKVGSLDDAVMRAAFLGVKALSGV